jgi:hypothetical protein
VVVAIKTVAMQKLPRLGQRVGFNTVSHKNSLSFGIDSGA